MTILIAGSVLTGVLTIIILSVSLYEKGAWVFDKDTALMEKECSSCHNPDRPKGYAKSPDQWEETVRRMNSIALGKIPVSDQKRITELLIRKRSADGATLYKARCGRCHLRAVIDPFLELSPEALGVLIEQHVRQNNFAIQMWEGELIINYLQQIQQDHGLGNNSDKNNQVLFQNSCGQCHTTTFLYKTMCAEPTDYEMWTQIVDRMRLKTPTFIDEKNVPALASYCKKLCAR